MSRQSKHGHQTVYLGLIGPHRGRVFVLCHLFAACFYPTANQITLLAVFGLILTEVLTD